MMAIVSNTTYPLPDEIQYMAAPFSFETLVFLELGIYIIATGSVAVFGVGSNIINIVVFYRQGILSNSAAVNLTGLAVSDLLNCLITVWRAVCLTIAYFSVSDGSSSTAYSLSFVAGMRPLEVTVQITCWITAFMAFERVICVVFPFKVKSIFTPKRSLAVIAAIFVVTFILCIPLTFDYELLWAVNPANNITYLANQPSGLFSQGMFTAYFYTNPVILRFSAIFIVAACNIILIWKVNLSKKFRKITTGLATAKGSSSDDKLDRQNQSKEMKLLRMITVISLVFTLCYILYVPFNVVFWLVYKPHVDIHKYHNHVTWDIVNFFQIVNSSTNIIIYYTMSSKFKDELKNMWFMKG